MMKKILFLSLALLLCMSQTVLAKGARDLSRGKGTTWTHSKKGADTAGKCDEQYFSVIKLKIDRPQAIPFTINANGGQVEFSSGNLQYNHKARMFRFAREQYDVVYYGQGSYPSFTPNADHVAKPYATAIKLEGTPTSVTEPNAIQYKSLKADGTEEIFTVGLIGFSRDRDTGTVLWDSIVTTHVKYKDGDVIKIDTLYDTIQVLSNYLRRGRDDYWGWQDWFFWASSGYDRQKEINASNKPPKEMLLDTFVSCISPISRGGGTDVSPKNPYGIGPSYALRLDPNKTNGDDTDTIPWNIDTTSGTSRNYDWGYRNHIYCVWKGYDTCKATFTENGVNYVQGADSIVWDSTMFNPATWRTLTAAEWNYMLTKKRGVKLTDGYTDTSYAYVNITRENGKRWYCIAIFPDNFDIAVDCPGYSTALKSGNAGMAAAANFNTVTYNDYKLLEKQGVVFLPMNSGGVGYYWSASTNGAEWGLTIALGYGAASYSRYPNGYGMNRNNGYNVRLVRDLDTETLETAYRHHKFQEKPVTPAP